jgi:hypothetical protein
MASKSLPNLGHLHRKGWPPQPGERPVIEPHRHTETGPCSRTPKENGCLPVLGDNRLYFRALWEILESDNYHVALVPRGEWDFISGSRKEPPSTEEPTVLLPFRWKDLVAQVCDLVRDSNGLADRRVAQFAGVGVDFMKMQVSRSSGEPIPLTSQEFKTLRCFLLNPGRVFSRSELLNEAWGYENYPSTRTVDNHVLRLRQKLERDPSRPVHFRTVHGVGYKFVP